MTMFKKPPTPAEEALRILNLQHASLHGLLHAGLKTQQDAIRSYQQRHENKPKEATAEPPHILISEVLIHRAVAYLIGDEHSRERLLFVTAVEKGNTKVLSETFVLPTTEQSAVGVAAHPGHFAALMERLHERGHQLAAILHSHPTNGRYGTQPSARDLAHQKRLADFGMAHVIGGIVSRDGEWMHLFNPAEDFSVSLLGCGSVDILDDEPRNKILKLDPMEPPHGPVRHHQLAS